MDPFPAPQFQRTDIEPTRPAQEDSGAAPEQMQEPEQQVMSASSEPAAPEQDSADASPSDQPTSQDASCDFAEPEDAFDEQAPDPAEQPTAEPAPEFEAPEMTTDAFPAEADPEFNPVPDSIAQSDENRSDPDTSLPSTRSQETTPAPRRRPRLLAQLRGDPRRQRCH